MTAPLILVVAPRGPKGIFIVRIEGTALCVRASRNPLLAVAKSLLDIGIDPKRVLILRNLGSNIDRVSGPIEIIVQKLGKKGREDLNVGLDGRRKGRLGAKIGGR